MNNNKNDEAALLAGCKGVFSKTSYNTFGTADKPEEYIKKANERSTFKGKQFGYAPPKEGMSGAATNDVYFEKKHPWIRRQGDKYVDKIRYKDAQSDTKKGFLTSDFSKRDEFSNTIRTEQFREQLSQEDKYSKKALLDLSKQAGMVDMPATTSKKDEDGPLLYDMVFEKEDPKFKGCSRTHRDTKNPTSLGLDRAMGGQMTSQRLSFQPPTEYHKAEHGRTCLVKDTFYRQTNTQFPSGHTADPSFYPIVFSTSVFGDATASDGGFYFNVHTLAFPAGEIRGQFFPPCQE
eukprot:gene7547-696_t